MKIKIALFTTIVGIITLSACKKDPGPGGMATIKGKLIVRDYDANFNQLKAEFPAQGENVFICYDGIDGASESVKTDFDGNFQFDYLRPGKYTVFAVGKDSTNINSNKTTASKAEVEITSKKQIVKTKDLIILD